MPFPMKEKAPVGGDAEGAAIDMLVVGEPPPPPPGEEGEEGAGAPADPQVLLSRIEADLAQLRQLIPAS